MPLAGGFTCLELSLYGIRELASATDLCSTTFQFWNIFSCKILLVVKYFYLRLQESQFLAGWPADCLVSPFLVHLCASLWIEAVTPQSVSAPPLWRNISLITKQQAATPGSSPSSNKQDVGMRRQYLIVSRLDWMTNSATCKAGPFLCEDFAGGQNCRSRLHLVLRWQWWSQWLVPRGTRTGLGRAWTCFVLLVGQSLSRAAGLPQLLVDL